MKKSSQTLLLVAGIGIGVVLLKRQADAKKAALAAAAAAATPAPAPGSMLPGMNGADVLLKAPTGETIAASGQVLGWLGDGYETNDVYDAAPHQYMHPTINDLGRFSMHSVTHAAQSVVAPVAAAIAPAIHLALKPLQQATAATSKIPVLNSVTRLLTNTATEVLVKAPTMVANATGLAPKPPAPAAPAVVAAAATSGITQSSTYMGHTIWAWNNNNNGSTQYIVDYDANASQYSAGPFPTQAAAQQGIQQMIWASMASSLSLAQQYGGHAIYTMNNGSGSGVVYLIDPPQPASPPTQAPVSGASFAPSYPTMASAQAAIDAGNTVQNVQASTVASNSVGVSYGGHVILSQVPDSPPFTPFYVVDPVMPPAYSAGGRATSSPPFAYGGYPTQAAAMAAIDAVNGTSSPSAQQTSSANPYANDPGTTLATSGSGYSYDAGASSGATTSDGSTPTPVSQPDAAPVKSGGGGLLALVGAGVVGAGAYFLSK